ncbi:hypothetical protein WJX73_001261 [Symbiochloris irregularis]|uniref:Methyltransferase n=1 Tax=Symbiochloris irregularis TaxID=706552 RepID=A0AAW1NNQ3_9CHLO
MATTCAKILSPAGHRKRRYPAGHAARALAVTPSAVSTNVQYVPPPGEGEAYVRAYSSDCTARHTTNFGKDIRTVEVKDARLAAKAFDLHRDGFTLSRLKVPTLDWKNAEEVKRWYYPLALQLVKDVSGASEVCPAYTGPSRLAHVLREGKVNLRTERRSNELAMHQPNNMVHVDFTAESGPERLAEGLPREAKELLQQRFAIVQVWRPIVGPVQESPLAFVDACSVELEDLVPVRLDHPERQSAFYALQYSPRHRFYYYKGMTASEAVVFKSHDSCSQSIARFSPHCAFHDPSTSETAAKRQSVEFRALAFFKDKM